jgi:hypothetical protein
LRYQGNFAAGKNKIINGDFFINQRSFTSTTTTGVYTFDRWRTNCVNGTNTYSAQTLTQSTGLLPLATLSGSSFLRIVTTGQSASTDFTAIVQPIENAATFQGQTVTVSFYAKAASGTPKVSVNLATNELGIGQVSNPFGSVTITTSWVRYSLTATLLALANAYTPSGSVLEAYIITSAGTSNATFASSIGSQNTTIDIWGVQVEAGSTATAFQTASGGSQQAELAMCQRYYNLLANGNNQVVANGGYYASNLALGAINLGVTMRTTPTLQVTTGTNYYALLVNSAADTLNSFTLDTSTKISVNLFNSTEASGTSGAFGQFRTQNASAFVALSAEY